ncbi:hypothetical protein [Acetobacter cerevisiae]|uniref:Uncharacterized protein n=1 Tax=Acetobacter cerevisiae TaxID=178900 RepID=A0A149Q7J8_9PROT|nr:hypothetical protein [Acetobacter cerevisiae]KXU93309.1 hypothetical protein AD928_09035 [Acetobacter cerevisiae]GBQ10345.1 hypothetical protein AA14362_2522 [Acetobacter cerevisiae DSM 14362]
MAVIAKSLQSGTTLTSSKASVFTAGSGTYVVTSGVLSNPTTEAVAFTLQIKRSGGVALDLIPERSIQANGTDLLPELSSLVLTSGDQLLASGAGLVCVLNGYALS